MSYRFDSAVRVCQGKKNAEYLILSPAQSLRIIASNSNIADLLNGLATASVDISLLNRINEDEQASALLKELIKLQIVHDEPDEINLSAISVGQFNKSICIVSNTEATGLSENFKKCGYAIGNEDFADYYVVISHPYDFALMSEWNRKAIERKKSVLFACIHMSTAEIGPLVIPEESACFNCLERRRLAILQNPNLHRSNWFELGKTTIDLDALGLWESLIVLTISRFAKGHRINVLINEQLIIDLTTFEIRNAPIRRFPHCEVCGAIDPIIQNVR